MIALLLACVPLPEETFAGDLDGDGWDVYTDCNDFDPDVHPGASDYCDGDDDNCSGDETDAINATSFYRDADGDGFGDTHDPAVGCEAPFGYVEDGGDCDDDDPAYHPGADEPDCTDPADYSCDGWVQWTDADGDGVPACTDCDDLRPDVHPGAQERCDGEDDDCDGTTDEDAAYLAWHPDADGDGWGTPDETQVACDRPEGWVLDDTDCDDGDGTVHPDANEACDGEDDDCDGTIDEDDPEGGLVWYVDGDGDGFGDPGLTVRSCTQPANAGTDATDCDDGRADVYPGAPEVCDGATDEDCDGEVDEDEAIDVGTWWYDRDDDGWGGTTSAVDCDAPSGYVPDGGDCNDRDDDVHPGGDELCERGEDEDCDGEVDEADAVDAPLWHPDADGDGYGDAASGTPACTQPSGLLADGSDCDDTVAVVHPGADEADCDDPTDYNCDGSAGADDADGDGAIACEDCDDADAARSPVAAESCNTVDDDCDGTTDEDDAVDATTWYVDADDDGYGDASVVTQACELPAGYAENPDDCDDADDGVHPGARESCSTDVDDDCDGTTNDPGAVRCAAFYADADGDGYGSTDAACLCEAESPYVATSAEDCDDDDGAVNPSAAEVCGDGLDNDCDESAAGCGLVGESSLADAEAGWYGEASSDYLAYALADAGDLDGDGADELLAGAFGSDRGAASAGTVFVFSGLTEASASSATAILTGASAGDFAGWAVAGPGDMDGDGTPEVAVGAYSADGGGAGSGALYVVSGATSGSLSAATATRTGTDADDCAGCALTSAGDTDGDGLPELLAGAWRESSASGSAGAAYLFRGALGGTASVSGADAVYTGAFLSDQFGWAVAGAGDVDGDGYDDVLVGAPGNDDNGSGAGAVYLFAGPPAAAVDVADAEALFMGEDASDGAGYALAGPADVDADGYADLVVGAPGNDRGGGNAGAAYVVLGPASGVLDLGSADGELLGEYAGDDAGSALVAADFDGDGASEVAVGGDGVARASYGAVWIATWAGAGVVALGDADAVVVGEATSAGTARALAAPDLDGDGFPDLAVGSYLDDVAASDAGAVRVMLGGAGF
ncbi:MAG: MopE-related protein [Myxococcota bacterium]